VHYFQDSISDAVRISQQCSSENTSLPLQATENSVLLASQWASSFLTAYQLSKWRHFLKCDPPASNPSELLLRLIRQVTENCVTHLCMPRLHPIHGTSRDRFFQITRGDPINRSDGYDHVLERSRRDCDLNLWPLDKTREQILLRTNNYTILNKMQLVIKQTDWSGWDTHNFWQLIG